MVSALNSKAAAAGMSDRVTCSVADCSQLPEAWTGRFDAVFGNLCLMFVPDQRRALKEVILHIHIHIAHRTSHDTRKQKTHFITPRLRFTLTPNAYTRQTMPSMRIVLPQAARCLKPGAIAVFTTWGPLKDNAGIAVMYDALEASMQKAFDRKLAAAAEKGAEGSYCDVDSCASLPILVCFV